MVVRPPILGGLRVGTAPLVGGTGGGMTIVGELFGEGACVAAYMGGQLCSERGSGWCASSIAVFYFVCDSL